VIVGCGEPAGQLIGSDERDGGDRHHEVSILIASCLMVGRWRGTQPAANVSMITMREPQHGQGCVGCSIDAAASSLHFIFAAGVVAAINSRARASVAHRLGAAVNRQ
jgi:hypothetical protein